MSEIIRPVSDIITSPYDIVNDFHSAHAPIEALIKFSREHLTWTISQLFCAPDGSGDPLILMPFQSVMLKLLWDKKFPMILAARGGGKTFMLAVYALLRTMLIPGEEVVIIGKAFRQSKKVFEYLEKIYLNSPLVQESLKGAMKKHARGTNKDPIRHGTDRYEMNVGMSKIIALPVGDGESIRGQRATILLVDEFASINEEILEIVISPFLSVHKNPQKSALMVSILNKLEEIGADQDILDKIIKAQGRGNQMIISGTASSPFNHFYKYFQQYEGIIKSGGDGYEIRKAMAKAVQGSVEAIPESTIEKVCKTWKEYAVYQIPYTSMPPGYLDEAMIARNRLMFTEARFRQEYLCEFPDETAGFIPYSIIKEAMPTGSDAVQIELYGDRNARYVAGIDPARQHDYFAVVILKLTESGAKVVYCQAWQKKEFTKIIPFLQELFLIRFNVVRVSMDKGGGGDHIQDLLKNRDMVQRDDDLIWAFDDDSAKFKKGRRILEMVNFTNSWKEDAIHGLKSDIEHKRLVFPEPNITMTEEELMGQFAKFMNKKIEDYTKPQFNRIVERMTLELHGEEDAFKRTEDGIIQHINEAINETCAIERVSIAGSTAVKYDLPKISEQQHDVRHRDRFTALMLAAYAARIEQGLEQSAVNIHYQGATNITATSKRRRPSVQTSRQGSKKIISYGHLIQNNHKKK